MKGKQIRTVSFAHNLSLYKSIQTFEEGDEGCVICQGEDYEDDNLIVYCSVSIIISFNFVEM